VVAQEPELQAFAAAIPALVFLADPAGFNTFTNARFQSYAGKPAENFLSEEWLLLLHPHDVSGARARWSSAVESGTQFEGEYRFRRHDGDYRWHLVRAEPANGPDNAVLPWARICFDINDQRPAISD